MNRYTAPEWPYLRRLVYFPSKCPGRLFGTTLFPFSSENQLSAQGAVAEIPGSLI